ncbi:DUF202 domain-containing protein [Nocardiopsis kunsanensis]|uniref:DUF202 domain-containing protein n=1 Tax=Nocardiopsis kunsanensis TaxID=141693 RepID=A0A919CHS4_9ACTN|nr:DUF202 domain-containing protein [Nocardiopsis kunsanensis]GHD25291.1 hypothetical protein GCM10007147_22390 [Nocardiopsis kunsanensis]
MSTPGPRSDPGLQPERTLMSWQRTLALVLVVGLLYMRGSLVPGQAAVPELPPQVRVAVMVALLIVFAAVATHVWLRWRRTAMGSHDPATGGMPRNVGRPWAVLLLCAVTLSLSVLLFVTTLLR